MTAHPFRLCSRTCGVAVLSVVIALLLAWLLDPLASMTRTPFLLFSGAVVVAAWRGGVWAGLLATGLAGILSNFFFVPPLYTLHLSTTASVRLSLFILEGIAISLLCGSSRTAHQRLDRSYLKLRKSEESLRHANQWITDILESVTDGFYALDLQWRFVYVNPPTERLLQRSRDDLLGQSIWDVLSGLEGTRMAQNFRWAMANRCPVVFETSGILHPDRVFEMHINPLVEGLAVYFQDVTHRKQDERTLRQHMQMLDLANDSILIRDLEDDTILYWNQGAVRQYGWTPEEAVGQPASDLLKTVLPEPIEAMREAIFYQGYWTGEISHTMRDGRTIIVSSRWTLQQMPQGEASAILEINHDITERKQAEEALRRSELHFRTLADTMPQIFWTARPDGALDYYNQRWYEYTGMTQPQSLGWGWQLAIHPQDLSRSQQIWAEALQMARPLQTELRVQMATDRQFRWHLIRAFPLQDDDGNIIKWFGSYTDIHDHKLALEQRDLALVQERTARAEAEAANRTKDEFLAVLSHELRTPLNPILGWIALMRSRPLDQATRDRALETIERNAKHQTQLIEDLLDMSRILRGKLALDIQPVDLVQTIQAALETVQLSAHAKNIILQVNVDPTVGSVAGDQNRLQQIFWNLLSNAVKFTPEGGQVTVTLSQDHHHAVIQVKDTGQGIEPEFLPYVFERFRQADSGTNRSFGGLGLGLAIVRYLTELHGGEVAADSHGKDQGATFTVQLPMQAAALLTVKPTKPRSTQLNLAGLTVLVIDDDRDLLDLLTVVLEDYNMQVLTADSARDGLRLVERHQPDVLISDIGMPETDGYSLMQTLRQRFKENGRKIPAIALTSYAGDHNRQRALKAGFQRHMAKPVDLEELGLAIAALTKMQ